MKEKSERIKKANKTYCDGHDQEGIRICSWENMKGWQKFLKGEINEAQLSSEAKQELAELNDAFGKYLRSDSDSDKDRHGTSKEDPLGEKVKTANKIYRKVCVDSGMSPCLFKNFDTWQKFVHGEMAEDDFYEKAREEIRKIAAARKGTES